MTFSLRGFALGLPDTRPRSPLRRLASASAEATADAPKRLRREGGPVAWLARHARSRCYLLAVSCHLFARRLSDWQEAA